MQQAAKGTILSAAVLAVIGFVAVQVFLLNRDIGKLEGNTSGIAQRVDRIAEALPDLRIQLASEELRKDIDVALVAEAPVQQSDGLWRASLHVVDGNERRRSVFTKEATGPDDRSLTLIAQSVAREGSERSLGSEELKRLLEAAGRPEKFECPFCGGNSAATVMLLSADENEVKAMRATLSKYAVVSGSDIPTKFESVETVDIGGALLDLEKELSKGAPGGG